MQEHFQIGFFKPKTYVLENNIVLDSDGKVVGKLHFFADIFSPEICYHPEKFYRAEVKVGEKFRNLGVITKHPVLLSQGGRNVLVFLQQLWQRIPIRKFSGYPMP